MIYKTFEEWKAGQWLEDGEPRTKAYTKDELLLIEMGWQYGFDAGKETKELTDEKILKLEEIEFDNYCVDKESKGRKTATITDPEWAIWFARAILRKAQEK